ncbi:MAG: hypothetical protein ACTTJW_08500 [Sphaerochaeta sp.]
MSLSNILAMLLPWAAVVALVVINKAGLKKSEKEKSTLQKTIEKYATEREVQKHKVLVSEKVSEVIADAAKEATPKINIVGMVSPEVDAIKIAKEQAERAYSQQEVR